MTEILWAIFAFVALLHYFFAKILLSPRSNTPELFRGSFGTFLLSILLFAFLSITALGFMYTDLGWYFLAGWIAVTILLAPRPKQPSTTVSFDVFTEAEPWFHSSGIDSDSVEFSVYDGDLARTSEATILVGVGDANQTNERIGFAVEVVSGRGVVSSEFIRPYGIASQHRTAAVSAQNSGQPLLDVLLAAASNHRAKYGISND